MEENQEIYFKEKYNDRTKAVLRLLDGMSVYDAIKMLEWCQGFVSEYTTIDWHKEADRQRKERMEMEAKKQTQESL